MKKKERGQRAYEAYCQSWGWKSAVSGDPLPQWPFVPADIKKHWAAVEEKLKDAE